MENEMILKEISKILDRVNEEDKKEILNSSRRVLDRSMGHDASKVDATLWKRSEQEFEKLDLKGKMSVNACDFEKSIIMLQQIAKKMDSSKKFRMMLEYDPELLAVMISYYGDDCTTKGERFLHTYLGMPVPCS